MASGIGGGDARASAAARAGRVILSETLHRKLQGEVKDLGISFPACRGFFVVPAERAGTPYDTLMVDRLAC